MFLISVFTQWSYANEEFYWGVATDISKKSMSKELFVGKRTFDTEKLVVTDDQLALSESSELRPQVYVFDLKNKKVDVLDQGKSVGSGAVVSYKLNAEKNDVVSMKYNYKTKSYSYEGEDILLGVSGLSKYQVNRERGTVKFKGGRSTFEIVYIPISAEEYTIRKSEMEAEAKGKKK